MLDFLRADFQPVDQVLHTLSPIILFCLITEQQSSSQYTVMDISRNVNEDMSLEVISTTE
jgi:hypothetical protein